MSSSIDGSDSIIPLLFQSKTRVLEPWDRRLADQSSRINRNGGIHRTIDLITNHPNAVGIWLPGQIDRIKRRSGCDELWDWAWSLSVRIRRHFGGCLIMGSRPD